MTALMVATAATTLSACAVRQGDKEAAPPPVATPERKPGEVIERSPTQPPAEIDPPHQDPGPRVPPPPPPGNEATTPS